MKLTGADILIRCLKEQGVDTVFGYPGGCVLDIYDALYRDGTLRHILTAHEQGAAHAADGYARSTGKTGVCFATSGPGATNLVTGIATAYMDSVPLVAITGNVTVPSLGRDSFQEVDIAGITMPVTKHNYIVKDVKKLAATVREAFYIAGSGRKGPVLIDIPKNIQTEVCDYEELPPAVYVPKPVAADLRPAADALARAARPLIIAGGGCIGANATEGLKALAEKWQAPVCSTLMGLGAFPASDPRFLGMIGMHGTEAADAAFREADTVLVCGMRFSDRVAGDRVKFREGKTIVQFDIDAAEIDKNVDADVHVMGDLQEIFRALLPLLPQMEHEAWLREISALQKAGDADIDKNLPAYKILTAMQKFTDADTPVATDVGQHQMWTAQYCKFEKPRTFLSSGGLGTMGFGMGAAIGACTGTGRKTVLVTGDGSFHMNLNELCTAVSHRLPLVILLMDNNTLGMVRQWQGLFYGKRYSQTTLDRKTDYIKLAEAFGAKGYTIAGEKDILPVLQKAFAEAGPVLVDCKIGIDDKVLPMIPPGKSYDSVITRL